MGTELVSEFRSTVWRPALAGLRLGSLHGSIAPLRRSNFGKLSGWPHAVRSIGAEGLHFHDLRHTGNTFAAAGGASIKDLMARMGHDSERAALIYQHQARGADKLITDSIDVHVEAQRRQRDDGDGQASALGPVG